MGLFTSRMMENTSFFSVGQLPTWMELNDGASKRRALCLCACGLTKWRREDCMWYVGKQLRRQGQRIVEGAGHRRSTYNHAIANQWACDEMNVGVKRIKLICPFNLFHSSRKTSIKGSQKNFWVKPSIRFTWSHKDTLQECKLGRPDGIKRHLHQFIWGHLSAESCWTLAEGLTGHFNDHGLVGANVVHCNVGELRPNSSIRGLHKTGFSFVCARKLT
ncbi:hypothetical protein P7K49_000352 [Saguinus oedipus]|uniref:Uncharacterized protein n=1 Tax=Saguinus oedipus TaxID=9490 RepID=A0ABQ9WBI0_SAGOE|nr:hypothetical protein P7K49_000352 [Saguinus oedipus]